MDFFVCGLSLPPSFLQLSLHFPSEWLPHPLFMASPSPTVKGPIDGEDLLAKINAVLDFGVEYGDPTRFGDNFLLEVDWSSRGPKKNVIVRVHFTFPDDIDEEKDLGQWVQRARECMTRFYALRELLERRFELDVDLDEKGGSIVIRSVRLPGGGAQKKHRLAD